MGQILNETNNGHNTDFASCGDRCVGHKEKKKVRLVLNHI